MILRLFKFYKLYIFSPKKQNIFLYTFHKIGNGSGAADRRESRKKLTNRNERRYIND